MDMKKKNYIVITKKGREFLKECYRLLPEVDEIIKNSKLLSLIAEVSTSITDDESIKRRKSLHKGD